MFTDAAREDGVGYGGHTSIRRDSDDKPAWLAMGQVWPRDILDMLQSNEISMPAGETFGAVVVIDAVLFCLPNVSHVTLLTDCSATAISLNSGGSGSEQMNSLIKWMFNRHPHVQFLGIHLPGLHNGAADALSRDQCEAPALQAQQAGMSVAWLRPFMGATDLFRDIAKEAQR